MKLKIRHRTTYRFDHPVFLEPHVIRLRPRADAAVRPLALALDIDPLPAVRADNLDPESNVVTQAWFDGTTDRLTVESRSTVETLSTNPFEFLLDDPKADLPYAYPAALASRLSACCDDAGRVPPDVRALAQAAADEVGSRKDRFPWALTSLIHRQFQIETRDEGMPKTPEATLADRRGACRDLAVLYMACCRGMGLAARFVSGYAHVDDGGTDAELHAWAEIYLPGGGWRGYDPTLGLAVADRHVAVAAAADPADAAPVSGTFRGSARGSIDTSVELTVVPAA